MAAAAPWSVKGIDPKAREVAKDLARRSGMTLGEWLNRMILEDEDPEEVACETDLPPRLRPAFAPEADRVEGRLRLLEARALPLGVEPALQRMADRLAEAESRTSGALAELRRAMTSLDGRVGAVDNRYETLALGLTQRVEQVRAETAEALRAAAPAQLDARLTEVAEQVRAAERRSAQALERMGREVLAMAEVVNRRLGDAEQRGADAIEQVGGEIARIAGAVEARLGRAEQAQAQALERLGVEIGKATDRLTERLMTSERRAAEAIDEVGEQVSRVTERIEQRHERHSTDLAERIRASEERTVRLLEEARARAPSATTARAPEPEAAPRGPFGPELFSRAEPEPDLDLDLTTSLPERLAFARQDFEAADGFAPIPEGEEDVFELDEIEPPTPDGSRPLSTREVIEQARAAARAAQAAARPLAAAPAQRAASGRAFNPFGAPRRRRQATPLQTALMVAGGAAFLSVGAAGVVLMERRPAPEEGYEVVAQTPRAAVALAPQTAERAPADPASEAALAAAAQLIESGRPGGLERLQALAEAGHGPAQFYLAQLHERGGGGLTPDIAAARSWTARAAEGGEPGAMHNLGLYYFRGEGGPQDLVSAAQWFRKAAELGVTDSQYNLGMMYQTGSGAPRDLAEARRWFSRAAAQGDAAARDAMKALEAPAG